MVLAKRHDARLLPLPVDTLRPASLLEGAAGC